jgi:hypothetical protein
MVMSSDTPVLLVTAADSVLEVAWSHTLPPASWTVTVGFWSTMTVDVAEAESEHDPLVWAAFRLTLKAPVGHV